MKNNKIKEISTYNTKHNNRYRNIFLIVLIAITTLIFSYFLLIYYMKNTSFNMVKRGDEISKIPIKQNKQNDTLVIISELESKTEILTNIEYSSRYLNKFLAIVKDINSKLLGNYNSAFLKQLKELADESKIPTMNNISRPYKYIKEISSILSSIKIHSITSNSKTYHTNRTYYEILVYYYLTIELTKKIYDWGCTDKQYIKMEHIDLKKHNTIKVIYQQMHIKIFLDLMLVVISEFNDVILSLISDSLKNDQLKELVSNVADSFELLNENMFIKSDYRIKLKNIENMIETPYLLNGFEYYRRFLILNMCIIYLQLFNVNNDYEVVNFKEDVIRVINEIKNGKKNELNKKEDTLDIPMVYIETCRNIFLHFYKLGTEDENQFFKDFNSEFYLCSESM